MVDWLDFCQKVNHYAFIRLSFDARDSLLEMSILSEATQRFLETEAGFNPRRRRRKCVKGLFMFLKSRNRVLGTYIRDRKAKMADPVGRSDVDENSPCISSNSYL